MSDTIDVDGVRRPVHNSAGRLLHPTEDGIRNFWRWFGDSRVVDREGRPHVVYHGTAADFSRFGTGRGAIYLTADPSVASVYACQAERIDKDPAPNVMPVYFASRNPFVMDESSAKESLDQDGARDWTILDNILHDAEEAGHDGAILRGVFDFSGWDAADKRTETAYDQFIAFVPTQLKSALSNSGRYCTKDACITDGVTTRIRPPVEEEFSP